MIPRAHSSRRIQAASATLLLALTSTAHAVDFYKADNEANLDVVAAWTDSAGATVATPPANGTGSVDTWIWDSHVTGTGDVDGINSVTVGAGKDLGVQTIRIVNPAVPVSFNGNGRTFTTTGSGGIDMSAATQDLTLQNMFYRVTGGVTIGINVAAGRTLTFGSTAVVNVRNTTSNGIVNFNTNGTSTGKIIFGSTFAPSHVVIGGGRVEFNGPSGSTRIATASPNPVSYTNINAGLLLVNNTTGSATGDSIVNVNDTGTLGGTGKITGTTNSVVNANAGSTVSPGTDGIGTLSIGKLNLAAGSKIVWEAANTSTADLIAITTANGLTINGGTIYLYNPGTTTPLNATGLFTLITYTGSSFAGSLSNLSIDPSTQIPGYTYTLIPGAGTIQVRISNATITPVDWNADASGSWSTGTNWTGGLAPDAIAAIVRISSTTTFTAPRTVTLDAPRTVGQLFLTSSQAITLDGTSTLTINDNGAAATLTASGASHAISAPLALTTGGLLTTVEDSAATLTLSGQISGTGVGISKSGSGTLLITSDNTYTGTTSVSIGTLLIGNGGTTGSVGGTIDVNGTLKFNRSDATTRAFAISGFGNVEFNGAGQVTIPLANTYSGTTQIGATGSLVLAHADALKSTTLDYTTTGGTLTVADPITAINLGGLSGNRPFPLANSSGTALALNVGANGNSTAYSGSPLGTGASLTKVGGGTLALSGTHAYSGATTVNAGVLSLDTGATLTTTAATIPTATAGSTARILVNGGTLTASAASLISNAGAGLVVAGGEASFNAGLANETGSSSGNPFVSVTGGTLNASSINLSRGALRIEAEPGSGQTANGLYINGGTVNVAGTLGIGALTGSNSSVSARMDAGSLAVGGAVTIGINNISTTPYRWSVLDINGGTFTSTDTATGVQLGNPIGGGHVAMLVRKSSAVVNVHRIQFGQGAFAGKSYLNLTAGSLYVGSGGMVLGSTAPAGTDILAGQFDAGLRLNGGTLGATADWTTSIPVSLGGTGAVVSGADANNVPHTITLQGVATGIVSLTKKNSGTVIFNNPANDIVGPTVVEAGVLKLAGITSLPVTVNPGATFAPLGAFTVGFDDIDTGAGTTINGTLAIGYNAASTPAVTSLTSVNGRIEIGATASLVVSGTGNLPGPAYVILKAAGGVTGTFASVSIPAGLNLNYAYDDDNNAGTPAVVALVGSIAASPYDSWTASFSLTGNNALASADPDGDGLANLLEFAFSSSPVATNSAPWTIARSGNFLTLSFSHPANSGLTYSVEATNDLAGTWTPVHSFPAFTTAATETYTDTVDLSTAATRRFLRLKITPAP